MIQFLAIGQRDNKIPTTVTMQIDLELESISVQIIENPPRAYIDEWNADHSKTFIQNVMYAWAYFCDALHRIDAELNPDWLSELAFASGMQHNVIDHDKTILVWAWDEAPEVYKHFSLHGGDENWVIFIPDQYKDSYLDCFNLPYCATTSARVPVWGGELLILGH